MTIPNLLNGMTCQILYRFSLPFCGPTVVVLFLHENFGIRKHLYFVGDVFEVYFWFVLVLISTLTP